MYPCCLTKTDWTLSYITGRTKFSLMKESIAFHKGIRRVWSRLSAGSGTSRLGPLQWQSGATSINDAGIHKFHCGKSSGKSCRVVDQSHNVSSLWLAKSFRYRFSISIRPFYIKINSKYLRLVCLQLFNQLILREAKSSLTILMKSSRENQNIWRFNDPSDFIKLICSTGIPSKLSIEILCYSIWISPATISTR